MDFDPFIAAAGLGVGFVIGLTGMGGGALMTPILVLLFKVHPAVAVSSDLVAALLMKPVGAAVHLGRGTVDRALVRRLCVGSVPGAFVGAMLFNFLGRGPAVEERFKVVLGVALLLAAAAMVIRAALRTRAPQAPSGEPVEPRGALTVAVGAAGGLIVGMTSVGSGSLMIVLLLMLYPQLTAARLVGTDLVQAIPLVGSAAIGHLLFGEVHLGLTASLLVGSLPGVYLGARLSSRAPDHLIRPVLVLVLVASALKLLGVSNVAAASILGGLVVIGLPPYLTLRALSARAPALPEARR